MPQDRCIVGESKGQVKRLKETKRDARGLPARISLTMTLVKRLKETKRDASSLPSVV